MPSQTDRETLTHAIKESTSKTSAELVGAIAKASDHYADFIILFSLLLGSLAAIAVWTHWPKTDFLLLMTIQLGIMAVCSTLPPPLRRLFLCFVPKHIRHQRAARQAYMEFIRVAHHVSADTPFLLFYISLAEHYVHILPSRSISERIPDATWQGIVGEFTSTLPKKGLQVTSIQAVQRISKVLAFHFPFTGKAHHFSHPVIETGEE